MAPSSPSQIQLQDQPLSSAQPVTGGAGSQGSLGASPRCPWLPPPTSLVPSWEPWTQQASESHQACGLIDPSAAAWLTPGPLTAAGGLPRASTLSPVKWLHPYSRVTLVLTRQHVWP